MNLGPTHSIAFFILPVMMVGSTAMNLDPSSCHLQEVSKHNGYRD